MRPISYAALLISLSAATGTAAAQDRIPIFVRSVGAQRGFTDPSQDRLDSVRDLSKRLAQSPTFRVVESEGEAATVIEVLDRGTTLHTNLLGPQNASSLTVRLRVRDYSTEFTGVSGPKAMLTGYGAAASSVVGQLETWVKSNRDRLAAAKSGA
jgi:hypothetical protein